MVLLHQRVEAVGTVCGVLRERNVTEIVYLCLLGCINDKGRRSVREKRAIVHASLASCVLSLQSWRSDEPQFNVLAASINTTLRVVQFEEDTGRAFSFSDGQVRDQNSICVSYLYTIPKIPSSISQSVLGFIQSLMFTDQEGSGRNLFCIL